MLPLKLFFIYQKNKLITDKMHNFYLIAEYARFIKVSLNQLFK